MPSIELLCQNLAIEADIRCFTGLVTDVTARLGGSRFRAARALIDLTQKLRQAGAGSGYPLPARLRLQGRRLEVHWGEGGEAAPVSDLSRTPEAGELDALRRELHTATQSVDPSLLLERNRQMARRMEETRRQMELEKSMMQKALARRQDELKESLRQAETDSLTGLLNRRAFDDRIGQAFRRTLRQRDEHLSLMLLDLDFFKEINDKHGHPYGDEHLKRMAGVLRGAIRRDVDFAFRFGGDEFALLMFVDSATACRKAHQILENMNHQVSIGVSSVAGNAGCSNDIGAFIRSADDALYGAKRAGRGRIMSNACGSQGGQGCTVPCTRIQEVRNG